MKNMRIILMLLVTWILVFMCNTKVYATQEILPTEVNDQITLYDDVSLMETFIAEEDETLTIDLNGHIIIGPTDGYAIENKGNLTIIDSSKKGKITSNYNGYSIHNSGQLKLNNVTIENTYKSVIYADAKDGNAKITIEDSKIIAG